MLKFDNGGWNGDAEDLLKHIGERALIQANKNEWGKSQVRDNLMASIVYELTEDYPRISKTQELKDRYVVNVYDWHDDDWVEVELVDTWLLKKQNSELIFLLKKGE